MSSDDAGDQEALVHLDADVRADQFDEIDEIATETGEPRSRIVQRLLDIGLASERAANVDQHGDTHEDGS